MSKMYRCLSILAAGALSLTLLGGCVPDGPQEEPSAAASAQVSEELSETPSVAPSPEPSEEPSEVPSPPSDSPAPSQLQPTMELNRTEIVFTAPDYTFQLTATFAGLEEEPGLVWTSSDQQVAAVDSSGLVTAIAPGTATISAKSSSGLAASCLVRCRWDEASQRPSAVDLQAFADQLFCEYSFSSVTAAPEESVGQSYPGLTAISAQQRLVYLCQEPGNDRELVLLELTNASDLEAAQAILWARVSAMTGGGAWFPESVAAWADYSRVVSSGSFLMLVVHPDSDAIVQQFYALFS